MGDNECGAALRSGIDSALDRLGVASKHDLDKLNSKLNRVLKSVGAEKKAAKKPAKKAAAKPVPAKRGRPKRGETRVK